MIDITRISQGRLEDSITWCSLYWVNAHGHYDWAIRQKADDKMWYVTKDYAPEEIILHGPYPSKEAIEMLMVMGMIDPTV